MLLTEYGTFTRALGMLDESEKAFSKALNICRSVLGPNHEQVISFVLFSLWKKFLIFCEYISFTLHIIHYSSCLHRCNERYSHFHIPRDLYTLREEIFVEFIFRVLILICKIKLFAF